MKDPKIELIWHGKDEWESPEPRLLIEKQRYQSDKEGIDDNLLIYGDNLLGLKSLERDYAGKVKCIYIDPPYNTKSCIQHYNDNLEHSVWLNMMKERLVILHQLLMDDGSIWISIDDSEMHYLKVVMDEIFGRSNFVGSLPTIMNLKGNQDQSCFAGTHEYTLVYAKSVRKLNTNYFRIDEEEVLFDWEEDSIGLYKKGANLKASGRNAPRESRPNLFFPIFIGPEDQISLGHKPGYVEILPMSGKQQLSWRWGKNKIINDQSEIIVCRNSIGITLHKKQRPNIGELPTKKPKSVLYKPEYSTATATNHIKQLFGNRSFDYPKSEHLISDIIHLATDPGDIVLDSFAGSGTTGAVAHKMGRRWIMIELGGHCHTHIIPRMEKVIAGEDPGGVTQQMDWQGGGGFRYCEMAY